MLVVSRNPKMPLASINAAAAPPPAPELYKASEKRRVDGKGQPYNNIEHI